MAKNLIAWDLDATLMDNVHDYAEPILDSIELIVISLGRKAPHVSAIMELEQKIDKARRQKINPQTGKPFLYSMERFPGSLVETYRQICQDVGEEPDGGVVQELWDIGMDAFDPRRYEANIHESARDVLSTLSKDNIQVLLTKGDEEVQQRKLAALQHACLLQFFADINIVPTKTTVHFDMITSIFRGSVNGRFISIGNSYDSDIKPAFGAGFSGIFVPVWNWEDMDKKDKILAEIDTRRCVVVDELSDVPEAVDQMSTGDTTVYEGGCK